MSELRPVGIRGTGSYLPEKVLSNRDLESMLDTSDEWITTRTGIKERRIAAADEATSDLALKAARSALEAAELEPSELDQILVATATGDFPFPSTACILQSKLGADRAGAVDLSAACTGFLYALSVGAQQVATGFARNVLVIGAETLSRILDYQDRSSCILFGDGAGAVILSSEFERGEVLSYSLQADGSGSRMIWVPAGGSAKPASHDTVETGKHFMHIRGREVYKFAVSRLVEMVERERRNHPDLELGLVIPHQVNQRIIDSARERLGLPPEAVFSHIERYGNTSAASIPIALDEVTHSGKLDAMHGKLIVLCAFGAGLTWASGALRW